MGSDTVHSAIRREFGNEDDEAFIERIWHTVEERRDVPRVNQTREAGTRSRAGRRRLAGVSAVAIACVVVAGGAIAAVTAGGGDDAGTNDSTSALVYSSALQAYALGRTPSVDPITIVGSRYLAEGGVVISDMHRGTARDGVTPYLAPATNGGLCALWEHNGGTWAVTCSPAATPAADWGWGYFDEPDGSYRYVGIEPDGVTSVTAADGTEIPVVDNMYVSRAPIE
jgi:hypothetical protein